jgi:hypothetical protein
MFSTKQDAINWIKAFGGKMNLTTKKYNTYWRIYKNGELLVDSEMDAIEDGELIK